MNDPSRVRVTGPLSPYAAGFHGELEARGYSPGTAEVQLQLMAELSPGEWPGGIAPPGSHRSRRDSLPSPGSCHLDHQIAATHAQWAKSRGCWLVMRRQQARAALKGRSRRWFRRSQRIR